MVRWLTDNVSDIRGVGRGKDDSLKLGRSRFEHRLQFVFITIQGFGLITNACESTVTLSGMYREVKPEVLNVLSVDNQQLPR